MSAKTPMSKLGDILKFWVGMDFWRTLFEPAQSFCDSSVFITVPPLALFLLSPQGALQSRCLPALSECASLLMSSHFPAQP